MIVVDEIESFIQSLDLSSAVVSQTGAEIVVENTFHARQGLTCFVDEVAFTIVSVDYSTKTIELDAVPASSSVFRMPVPFYFHGTPYATNAHISRLSDTEKVPMIYLLEIVRERLQSEDSAIETEAELRLFFLDVANFQNWNTDDHYSRVIYPQRLLVNAFVEQARKSAVFGELSEFDLINHIKFGVYIDNKGHVNSLFNERLSGIELSGSFPFRKKCC